MSSIRVGDRKVTAILEFMFRLYRPDRFA